MKHDHTKPNECKHSLKHCEDCDIVYCEKCEKEWNFFVNDWTYPQPYMPNGEWFNVPYIPSVTWNDNTIRLDKGTTTYASNK